jgi:putative membrane protein
LAVICLIGTCMVLFAIQNMGRVAITFLGTGLTLPLAVLCIVIYVLGAATGSSLFAVLRRSYAGARLGEG